MYLVITQKSDSSGSLVTFVLYNTREETEKFCKEHNALCCRVYELTKGCIAKGDGTFELKELIAPHN